MGDKLAAIVDWLEPLLDRHEAAATGRPFILGVSGVQGSGKSTLVAHLEQTLQRRNALPGRPNRQEGDKSGRVEEERTQHRRRRIAQVSLDDLYLTHAQQQRLAQESGYSVWRTRGQFGTHDVELARDLFRDLRACNAGADADAADTAESARPSERVAAGTGHAGREVGIPRYDKSLHHGQGDRMPESEWTRVVVVSGDAAAAAAAPLNLVILEGWGVGFQALEDEALQRAYEAERDAAATGVRYSRTASHAFREIEAVNRALKEYNEAFMGARHFDALVVLQAKDTEFVHQWRLQQEHAMWKAKGRGMTDQQVEEFVDRYYPSYELYLPRSIQGIFDDKDDTKKGHQLNLRMGLQRELQGIDVI